MKRFLVPTISVLILVFVLIRFAGEDHFKLDANDILSLINNPEYLIGNNSRIYYFS